MIHVNVKSTNIKSIAFEDGILEIAFLNGTSYQYRGVPQEVHLSLITADSKGKALAKLVKGLYDYKKIGSEDWVVVEVPEESDSGAA